MTTLDDIRLLAERFFDGDTTVEEERTLYAFYSSHAALPADMEQYRPLITDLGSMDFGETDLGSMDFGDTDFGDEKPAHPAQGIRHKLLVTLSGIAASLLVCITVYSLLQNHHERQQFAATYEGSYVIQDGKRIDDLSLIKTDIEHAISQAESMETHMEEQNAAIDTAEEDILKHASPEQRAQLEEMMK